MKYIIATTAVTVSSQGKTAMAGGESLCYSADIYLAVGLLRNVVAVSLPVSFTVFFI